MDNQDNDHESGDGGAAGWDDDKNHRVVDNGNFDRMAQDLIEFVAHVRDEDRYLQVRRRRW